MVVDDKMAVVLESTATCHQTHPQGKSVAVLSRTQEVCLGRIIRVDYRLYLILTEDMLNDSCIDLGNNVVHKF